MSRPSYARWPRRVARIKLISLLRLPGEVGDPRFLRFLEQVGDEQLKRFSTDDFLAIDLVHREEALQRYAGSR